MCLCWYVNVCLNIPVLNASLSHPVLFVLLDIFTAVHRSAFLGHFPQLQSNVDTSASRDGTESSRLVLSDFLYKYYLDSI